jgi:hypothetical protein
MERNNSTVPQRPLFTMKILPLTLVLFATYRAVVAGSVNKGGACNVGNNRLQIGTFQFWSECNSVCFCSDAGICEAKGCRRDDFPFGYAQGSNNLPPKCERGQFCPDEGTACQPVLPVGSPCQLNRDGEYGCPCFLFYKSYSSP